MFINICNDNVNIIDLIYIQTYPIFVLKKKII